jgi:hypothetical protein
MKTSYSSVCKAGLRVAGLILLSATVGVGLASAETFQHAGSMATIEQRGGGTSKSEVTLYEDGQKIVTQDGYSTDITIQHGGGSFATDDDWGYHECDDDRFDRQRFAERFSRGADDSAAFEVSGERQVLKQQIFDRMRGGFLP